jgi:hypothetical protein
MTAGMRATTSAQIGVDFGMSVASERGSGLAGKNALQFLSVSKFSVKLTDNVVVARV